MKVSWLSVTVLANMIIITYSYCVIRMMDMGNTNHVVQSFVKSFHYVTNLQFPTLNSKP